MLLCIFLLLLDLTSSTLLYKFVKLSVEWVFEIQEPVDILSQEEVFDKCLSQLATVEKDNKEESIGNPYGHPHMSTKSRASSSPRSTHVTRGRAKTMIQAMHASSHSNAESSSFLTPQTSVELRGTNDDVAIFEKLRQRQNTLYSQELVAEPNGEVGKTSMKRLQELHDFQTLQQKRLEERAHILEMRKKKPYLTRKWETFREKLGSFSLQQKTEKTSDEQQLDRVHSLFFLKSPKLYFFAIEFALLLQCFFNAIYFTQLLAIGNSLGIASREGSAWIAGLTVPVFTNFWIIRRLLTRTVMLKSICSLDRTLVSSVCENVFEEIEIVESVREKIIQNIMSKETIEKMEDLIASGNTAHLIKQVRNAFDVIDENR